MTASFPYLSLLILLPLAGAVLCLLLRRSDATCRTVALVTALMVFGVTLLLFFHYGEGESGWLLREDGEWIAAFGIRYTLSMDGLSLLLLLLTGFLQVAAVLVSWPVTRHVPFFFALLLVMESGITGVFVATDLFLFYLFWEVMLVPMFFLIGVWGHEHRLYAAVKFFLFTLAGSLLMLVALLALYLLHGEQTGVYTFALEQLARTEIAVNHGWWLYAAFLLAFAIKIPLFPFHTWLPDAHTEAPVAGSVDLAGLLLKTGVFGLVRIGFTLFPTQARASLPLIATLALIGLFHAAWVAYRQSDIKRLIAYSSVSHLGLVVLGLASGSMLASQGSLLLMLNHGITTGALFVMVALIQERAGTRELGQLGGLWARSPVLGGFFLLFSLSALGLPGLANFSGEILILLGTFHTRPLWGTLAMTGVVFTAAYVLRMVQGVLWGEPRHGRPWPDLNWREWLLLAPLALAVVLLGLWPQPFLHILEGPAQLLIATLGGMP